MKRQKSLVSQYFEFTKEKYFAFVLKNHAFRRTGKNHWWRERLDMVQSISIVTSQTICPPFNEGLNFRLEIGVARRSAVADPRTWKSSDFRGHRLDIYLPATRLTEKLASDNWHGWYSLGEELDINDYVDKEIHVDVTSYLIPRLDAFTGFEQYLAWIEVLPEEAFL